MVASVRNVANPASADPALFAAAVTPSDTADLTDLTTALYVGGTGNIQVTMGSGQLVVFVALPVGWHPIRVSRIWSTNTTATNIVACWR